MGAGGAGCLDPPSPGRAMPQPGPAAVTGAGRAAGWERSGGLGWRRMSGSSGRVGCSSLFPSAPRALPALLPASVSPHIPMPPLHIAAGPRVLSLGLHIPHTSSFLGATTASQRAKGELRFGVTQSDGGKTQRGPWQELSMGSCFCHCQRVGQGPAVLAWPSQGPEWSPHCGSPWVLPVLCGWEGAGPRWCLSARCTPDVILCVHGRRVLHIHMLAHLHVYTRVCTHMCTHLRAHQCLCLFLYPCVHQHPCRGTHAPVPVLVCRGAPLCAQSSSWVHLRVHDPPAMHVPVHTPTCAQPSCTRAAPCPCTPVPI